MNNTRHHFDNSRPESLTNRQFEHYHHQNSQSFAILEIPRQLTRHKIFKILRPFGDISFLQVSRISSSRNHETPKSEAYVTFSSLRVAPAIILSQNLDIDIFGTRTNLKIITKNEYMTSVRNRIFVKKLPKFSTR